MRYLAASLFLSVAALLACTGAGTVPAPPPPPPPPPVPAAATDAPAPPAEVAPAATAGSTETCFRATPTWSRGVPQYDFDKESSEYEAHTGSECAAACCQNGKSLLLSPAGQCAYFESKPMSLCEQAGLEKGGSIHVDLIDAKPGTSVCCKREGATGEPEYVIEETVPAWCVAANPADQKEVVAPTECGMPADWYAGTEWASIGGTTAPAPAPAPAATKPKVMTRPGSTAAPSHSGSGSTSTKPKMTRPK